MSTLEEFEKLNLSIEIMRKEIKRHNKNELSWLKSKLETLLSSKQFSEKAKIYYKLNLKDINKIENQEGEEFCVSFSRSTVVFQYYPNKNYTGDFFSLVIKKNKIKDFYYTNLKLFGTYLTKQEEVSMKVYFLKEVINTLVDYFLDEIDRYVQLNFNELINEMVKIENYFNHKTTNRIIKIRDLKLGDYFLYDNEEYFYVDKPCCDSFNFFIAYNIKQKKVEYFKGYVDVIKIEKLRK